MEFAGRGDRIRTCGILVPNQARYQLRYTSKTILLSARPRKTRSHVSQYVSLYPMQVRIVNGR